MLEAKDIIGPKLNCRKKKRSAVLQIMRRTIDSVLESVPATSDYGPAHARHIDWDTHHNIEAPKYAETTLVICASSFLPEAEECAARPMIQA